IEQFEEQNDSVEVDLEVVPFDELMESIEVRLSAESTDVDLLFVDAPLVANYTLKQYLTPLDNLLGENPVENWVDSAVDTVTYEDHLMAAPMNNSSQVLYYN